MDADRGREAEVARFRPQHGFALGAAVAWVVLFGTLGGLDARVVAGALVLGLVVAWLVARPRRVLTTHRVLVVKGKEERSVALRDVASVSAVPLLGRVVVRPREGAPLVLGGVRRTREAASRIRAAVEDSCEDETGQPK